MENFKKCDADWRVNEFEGFPPFVPEKFVAAVEQVGIESQSGNASEPFSFSPDGHVVGRDGFVVPRNFDEFYERNPMGIRRWLMRRLPKRAGDDKVRELEQELLLHLCSLPDKSKYRRKSVNHAQGCADRIQCFDPVRQHGASAKRFFNYVSLCLRNQLYTILSRQTRNPLCNEQNLTITDSASDDDQKANSTHHSEVSGEYLYQHSSAARRESNKTGWQANLQFMFIQEFRAFIEGQAPQLLVVVEAIACTGTLKEARESLGLTARTFEKYRKAIHVLKDRFVTGKRSHAATRTQRFSEWRNHGSKQRTWRRCRPPQRQRS